MKNSMGRSIAEFLRRALLVVVCGVFLAGAAYAQGGSCMVNQIRVRIGTAAQNPLAGTVNNIDLEIHFTNGTIQKAPDVNANMTWGVNSQNVVTIPLNQPVPVTEIKRIRLIYNISAGEWDMSFLRARAIGSVWSGRIAAWGSDPNPSPHRFTATYPAFGVDTVIPANACNLARMPVAGPVRLAPGVAVQNPARGSGPLLPSSSQQGMLVQQSSPALLHGARPANVGPAQTLSATGTTPSGATSVGNSGGGNGSGGSGLTSFQPLVPRSSSNTSSGGMGLMSLKPLTPRGNSNGGSNAGSASGTQKPLTNADVVSMLAQGEQEQTILTMIRTHRATFDVSNQARASFDRACAAINKPASLSTGTWATEIGHVWNAMKNVVICQETNGRGGEGACDLTPQQSSLKNTSAGPTPTQPKVPGRSKYDAITLESGSTRDTRFANWAQSGQAPNNGSPSTSEVKPPMNVAGAVYGQSGNAPGGNNNACDVTQIRMRIGTGGDDLRGGQDNLNVLIYLAGASPRLSLNVNSSASWPNNSSHTVVIPINPPVPPSEIRAIRLFHVPDGSFNVSSLEIAINPAAAPIFIAKALQSPDNWDMSRLEAFAVANGVAQRIVTHGFHRFTGSNPALTIYIRREAMANVCGAGRPAANSGSGSGGGIGSGLNPAFNPGGSGLRPITGGGTGAGALGSAQSSVLTNDGVVRMVKARVPESGIIAFIRANPAKFDLSPNALIALRQAGVSPTVQQEMIRHGSGPVSVPGTQPSGIGGAAKADDLNPQPYPPKGQLLNPGGQQTVLGTQANASPSTNSALVPAVQRSAITDGTTVNSSVPGSGGKAAIAEGTFTGGVRPAGTPQVGASHTMSAQGNVGSPVGQRAGTITMTPNSTAAGMARPPSVAQENPALYVAAACAKDPAFRIVAVTGDSTGWVQYETNDTDPSVNGGSTGNPGGNAGTLDLQSAELKDMLTGGHEFTILGCSFGSIPVRGISRAVGKPAGVATGIPAGYLSGGQRVYIVGRNGNESVEFTIKNWSDDSVTLSAPSGTGPDNVSAFAFVVQRADGSFIAYYF